MKLMVELSHYTNSERIITMDNPNCSTEHRKGQHLTPEERHDIEVHLKDGWSKYKISKHLGRPFNTIKNEISRGTVALYHGKVLRYKADVGQQRYNENRRSSTRTYRCLETAAFLKYVVKQFRKKTGRWMPASVGPSYPENSADKTWFVPKRCTTMWISASCPSRI